MKADKALEVFLNCVDQSTEGTVQKRAAPDLPPAVLHPKRLLASDGPLKSPVVTVSLV